MSWDAQVLMWGFDRQFIHETGHALMCLLLRLPCDGVAYDKTDPRFCTLVELPPPEKYTEDHYLFFAAGVAAERIVPCTDDAEQCEEGADADRALFPNDQSFEQAVSKATAVLAEHRTKIEVVRSVLTKKAKGLKCKLDCLPERTANGHRYAVILNAQEIKDVLESSTALESVERKTDQCH
jgi:hypothetical protein